MAIASLVTKPGLIGTGVGMYGTSMMPERLRSQTGSTIDSLSSNMSSGVGSSSAFTTPDLGLSVVQEGSNSVVACANGSIMVNGII